MVTTAIVARPGNGFYHLGGASETDILRLPEPVDLMAEVKPATASAAWAWPAKDADCQAWREGFQ